ncbi:BQ2448_6316 [Microbotryum intermedium]|uniref:BQ2448_6316 protein n=1 Tax=Microbotryum intermedium TaxID=269621 RepID=A0A238FS05_9BASI|nr:BQ2448_6316 [Microbotryum intermedium]
MSTTPQALGFIQDRLHRLPSALIIFLAVLLILLGLGINNAGARSMLVGSQWGKERGTNTSKPYIGGGVGGIFFGFVAFATLATLPMLAGISKMKKDLSIGSGALLALWICTGLVGGAIGARWRSAARSCCGVIGGLSISFLIIASLQLSSLLARSIITLILITSSVVLCLLPQTVKFLSVISAFCGAWIHFLGIDLSIKVGFADLPGLLVSNYGVSQHGRVEDAMMIVAWEKGRWKACVAGWWLMGSSGAAWQWYWGGEAGGAEKATPKTLLGTYTPPESFLARISHFFAFWRTPETQSARFTDLPNSTDNGRRRRSPWNEEGDLDEDGDTLSSRIWADDEEDELELEQGLGGEGASKKLVFGGRGGGRQRGEEVEEHELHFVKAGHRGRKDLGLKGGSRPARYDLLWDEEGDYELDEEDLGLKGRKNQDRPRLGYPTSPTRYSLHSGLSGTTLATAGEAKHLVHHGNDSIASGSSRHSPTTSSAERSRSEHPSYVGQSRQEFSPSDKNKISTRVPIPATPSLIKAIDRINVAQRQAREETLNNPFHETAGEETEYEMDLGSGKSSRPVSIKSTSSQASYDAWWAQVIEKSKGK